MPTPTYTPLASLTLSASAASVTFSSISQAYRDLVLVVNGALDTASRGVYARYNADTGSNYSIVNMAGDGSTTSSGTSSNTYMFYNYLNSAVANERNSWIVNLMDYSATDKHKTVLSRFGQAGTGAEALAGRWASTSAITSIQVISWSSNFTAGSSFALYGISA